MQRDSPLGPELILILELQGGSNMTGTVTGLFTHTYSPGHI